MKTCKICGKKCTTLRGMKIHTSRLHKGQRLTRTQKSKTSNNAMYVMFLMLGLLVLSSGVAAVFVLLNDSINTLWALYVGLSGVATIIVAIFLRESRWFTERRVTNGS